MWLAGTFTISCIDGALHKKLTNFHDASLCDVSHLSNPNSDRRRKGKWSIAGDPADNYWLRKFLADFICTNKLPPEVARYVITVQAASEETKGCLTKGQRHSWPIQTYPV